jgi:hypothetical protein
LHLHPLPDFDKDAVVALNDYGVTFAENKPVQFQIARLNLLAGLLWLHAHMDDLAAALLRPSTACSLWLCAWISTRTEPCRLGPT